MTSSWRNPPANPSIEQLAAVNELLQSIGQAPVSTLDTSNPDVSIAWNTLVSTSRDVQAEGWTFNTEEHIQANRSAAADTENFILLAVNELQVELEDNLANMHHFGVLRQTADGQRFLYDKEQHSDTWDYDPYVKKKYLFDWDVLPVPIQMYIVAKAAVQFSARVTGDTGQYRMLKDREDYTRIQALEYETSQGDYSFLGLEKHDTAYQTYQPSHSLRRF